jgi:hypothetical protein
MSFGNTAGCFSQAWKLPALVSTTAQGFKPSAESRASVVSLRSSKTVKRCPPEGTDIDMGAASVVILEEREPVEHRRDGDAVEAGKHTPIAQDADIVERRFYCCEHVANCNLGSVHRGPL